MPSSSVSRVRINSFPVLVGAPARAVPPDEVGGGSRELPVAAPRRVQPVPDQGQLGRGGQPGGWALGLDQSPMQEMFWLPNRSICAAPIITCRRPAATMVKTDR